MRIFPRVYKSISTEVGDIFTDKQKNIQCQIVEYKKTLYSQMNLIRTIPSTYVRSKS